MPLYFIVNADILVFPRAHSIRSLDLETVMIHRLIWTLIFTALLVGIAAAPPTLAGTLTGTVRVLADPPPAGGPASPFARRRPVEGHGQHSVALGDQRILVYLTDHPNLPAAPPPSENPVMNQIDLEIVPDFLAVPVGTTIDFPNSDEVYHNLFSVSSPARFDLGRYSQGKIKDVTFREPGEVRIFCDIHPHMSAIVMVMPNAFHTVVREDGSFQLEGIPAGEYEVRVWHESLGEQLKRVSIPDSGSSSVSFTFARN